jgi:hypothetical protein
MKVGSGLLWEARPLAAVEPPCCAWGLNLQKAPEQRRCPGVLILNGGSNDKGAVVIVLVNHLLAEVVEVAAQPQNQAKKAGDDHTDAKNLHEEGELSCIHSVLLSGVGWMKTGDMLLPLVYRKNGKKATASPPLPPATAQRKDEEAASFSEKYGRKKRKRNGIKTNKNFIKVLLKF